MRYLTVETDQSENRFIVGESDEDKEYDTSLIPDDIIKLFWYFFGYNKINISWIKLKKFIEEFQVELSQEQKLFLFNLKFKN